MDAAIMLLYDMKAASMSYEKRCGPVPRRGGYPGTGPGANGLA